MLWNRDMGSWAGTGARVETPVAEGEAEAAPVVRRGKGGGKVGEVVVYNVVGKSIPIVHRIMRRHATKGEKFVSFHIPPQTPGI